MEKETTEFDVSMRVIALQDLWDIFIHRLWVIVLAAVLVTGAYVAFDKITYVPEYESTATLYILRENEGESAYRSSDDFSLALKVVNDCEHLLKKPFCPVTDCIFICSSTPLSAKCFSSFKLRLSLR